MAENILLMRAALSWTGWGEVRRGSVQAGSCWWGRGVRELGTGMWRDPVGGNG